ncbi:AAA family ATPase [Shewanella algidipiscicola]|uniref:AAA family ATPase n=1 Tax=Shewanella algidipiscicola TaxID=614070 RepID=UPI000D781B78|nr:AAA family ATPase [Shewanella algidipiscicola]
MKYISQKYEGFEFEFSAVNVFLGANGAGKSTFLNEIRQHFINQGQNNLVYVEGGRTIKINDTLQLSRQNFQQYDRLDQAKTQHENKRKSSLADRVFDALIVLDKQGQEEKSRHSDSVEEWIESGSNGECPTRSQPPLDKMFEMFNEIFPLIELTFNTEARKLIANKNGIEYSPSQFSDGEKQVFSILADFIGLNEAHEIIIVDEPELNLHPELAERIWTLIENEYPEKIFIYASHSINFALRENVNAVYVLSDDADKITRVDSFEDLERVELSAFLGGLPGILSTNKVIVTEGHDKSYDSIFYRWLTEENSIEIYPGGGCTDVIDIVGKSGLWSKISTKISLVGVIDSDYRSPEYLSNFEKQGIVPLPFHEAESFLCIPEVIIAVGNRIGSQEKELTPKEVEDHIFSSLESSKLNIAAKRVFSKSKITLGVSLTKKVLAKSESADQLIEELKGAAEEEVKKAIEICDVEALQNLLTEEITRIDSAINNRDITAALLLLPGKELLNKLAPKAGCRNGDDLMRSLKRNFKPSEFEILNQLQQSLLSAVGS